MGDSFFDGAVDSALEATYEAVESQLSRDKAYIRDFYREATLTRTRDSFVEDYDNQDVLHVDISGDSALVNFMNEIELPGPFRAGRNLLEDGEVGVHSYSPQIEGVAEGLYSIFDESNAEKVLLYSDDERYFGPSMSGIASIEAVRKIEEDRNIHWQTRSEAEDYLWEEAFDGRDQELWSNWLDQRPNPE